MNSRQWRGCCWRAISSDGQRRADELRDDRRVGAVGVASHGAGKSPRSAIGIPSSPVARIRPLRPPKAADRDRERRRPACRRRGPTAATMASAKGALDSATTSAGKQQLDRGCSQRQIEQRRRTASRRSIASGNVRARDRGPCRPATVAHSKPSHGEQGQRRGAAAMSCRLTGTGGSGSSWPPLPTRMHEHDASTASSGSSLISAGDQLEARRPSATPLAVDQRSDNDDRRRSRSGDDHGMREARSERADSAAATAIAIAGVARPSSRSRTPHRRGSGGRAERLLDIAPGSRRLRRASSCATSKREAQRAGDR